MSASILEDPETTCASNIDRGSSSIHEFASSNATRTKHQGWHFDMQNPTSENHSRNPRSANTNRREDRSGYVESTGNNGEVQLGFEEEEEGDDESNEQDEPGVVGEFEEEEAEGEEEEEDG